MLLTGQILLKSLSFLRKRNFVPHFCTRYRENWKNKKIVLWLVFTQETPRFFLSLEQKKNFLRYKLEQHNNVSFSGSSQRRGGGTIQTDLDMGGPYGLTLHERNSVFVPSTIPRSFFVLKSRSTFTWEPFTFLTGKVGLSFSISG